MVNTFLVKMDHDCDGVSCVTYDDYHAEIERLRAELEALHEQNRALLDDQIPCACGYDSPDDVCGKHHPTFLRKIDAAHNSAIEAAALVQVLRMEEGGSRHMSPLSAEAQSAIRALKRPVTEGDKA